MDKPSLAREIYRISNIKGNFILRSGQQATEYFDKYLFEAQPKLLSEIAHQLIDFVKTNSYINQVDAKARSPLLKRSLTFYLFPLFKILPLDLLVTQRFDSINKISSLKVPLLMFHGTDDDTIPLV